MVASELIDNSHSSCPLFLALLVCRDKRRRSVDQFKILCWESSWLAMHQWPRNTLLQSNVSLTNVYGKSITIQFCFKMIRCEKKKFLYSFFILLTQCHEFPTPKLTSFHIFIIPLPLNVTLFSKSPYLTIQIMK